jgi:hypothetical protein
MKNEKADISLLNMKADIFDLSKKVDMSEYHRVSKTLSDLMKRQQFQVLITV